MTPACFKAYDIRGVIGADLDAPFLRRVGLAATAVLAPGAVVIGHDVRPTSPEFARALADGVLAAGRDVTFIGLCGTEEVYDATARSGAAGGLMVTASHNPIDYNGVKAVGPGSRPLDPETEFARIGALSMTEIAPAAQPGVLTESSFRADYAAGIAAFADAPALGPLTLLVNAGNGTAGPAFDAVLDRLVAAGARLKVTRMDHDPDPAFPNAIPNPLLPDKRDRTSAAVRAAGADMGIAWDGDFDRCFFFDETGAFVDGEYVVALLAESFLAGEPGATIVHDPRVIWATQDRIAAGGGVAVPSRTGHALIKAKMRETGAVYGGEMSAHHYFRGFHFCDSGMIPWLRIAALMSASGKPLSALVGDLRARFPSSGEINFRVGDPQAVIAAMLEALGPEARAIDRLDGVSLDFGDWRMNLRASNTEPLLRLNLEARDDAGLLAARTAEMRARIERLA